MSCIVCQIQANTGRKTLKWPTPTVLTPHWEWSSCIFYKVLVSAETRRMELQFGLGSLTIRSLFWNRARLWRTVGQTDISLVAEIALCNALRSKKTVFLDHVHECFFFSLCCVLLIVYCLLKCVTCMHVTAIKHSLPNLHKSLVPENGVEFDNDGWVHPVCC